VEYMRFFVRSSKDTFELTPLGQEVVIKHSIGEVFRQDSGGRRVVTSQAFTALSEAYSWILEGVCDTGV